MNCPKCSTKMVKARATNFGEEYDYCRFCKKELKEILSPSAPKQDKRDQIDALKYAYTQTGAVLPMGNTVVRVSPGATAGHVTIPVPPGHTVVPPGGIAPPAHSHTVTGRWTSTPNIQNAPKPQGLAPSSTPSTKCKFSIGDLVAATAACSGVTVGNCYKVLNTHWVSSGGWRINFINDFGMRDGWGEDNFTLINGSQKKPARPIDFYKDAYVLYIPSPCHVNPLTGATVHHFNGARGECNCAEIFI